MSKSYGYVSVIAQSLFEPIFRLVEALEETEPVEPNEVQTGSRENGYSCGVVVLSVLVLESAINRTRYVREGAIDRRTSSPRYFQELVSDDEIAGEVDEVFSIRNAIVHNHLWIANIDWIRDEGMVFRSEPELVEGSGDRRFFSNIDEETRMSRQLELNLFPSRIWRRDAYQVLSVVYKALLMIEELDRNYIYLSPQYFEFEGELRPIGSIIESLVPQ